MVVSHCLCGAVSIGSCLDETSHGPLEAWHGILAPSARGAAEQASKVSWQCFITYYSPDANITPSSGESQHLYSKVSNTVALVSALLYFPGEATCHRSHGILAPFASVKYRHDFQSHVFLPLVSIKASSLNSRDRLTVCTVVPHHEKSFDAPVYITAKKIKMPAMAVEQSSDALSTKLYLFHQVL